MPTTFVGLLVFVAFLTPGLLHYVQRRVLAPQRTLSPLVETATLASVSLATNALTLLVFGLLRLAQPDHTPDVGALLRQGSDYAIPRLPYFIGWAVGLLTLSCTFAVAAARWTWIRGSFVRLFAPVIAAESAWYHVFESRAQDEPEAQVYVGCDLKDGSYVAGVLDWYSTETNETADRDFVLGPPFVRRSGGKESSLDGFERVIISARDATALYVTWLREKSDRRVEAPSGVGSPAERMPK